MLILFNYEQQIEQKPYILLCKLCESLSIKTRVKVSVSTMYRIKKSQYK